MNEGPCFICGEITRCFDWDFGQFACTSLECEAEIAADLDQLEDWE